MQSHEFDLRSDIFRPLQILRQATSMGAEILQQTGTLGCVAQGAHADLIVVNEHPLRDIRLLAKRGGHLSVIMQAGEMIKMTLN